MDKKIVTLATLIIGVILSVNCYATVPEIIPIQGVLTDDEGNAIDEMVDLGFTIYDASVDGTSLWNDILIDVDVQDGFFTTYLGSNTPLNFASMVSSSELWLGIAVNDDAEMGRIRLAAVPFALEAQICQQVGSLTEDDINSNFLSSTYTPSWNDIADIPADIANGDQGFSTEAELTALLDDNYLAGNYTPAWSEITGIPSGFADGTDDNTTYTAGVGLNLSGTEFYLNYIGSGGDLGDANRPARYDHSHDNVYSVLTHSHDDSYIQNQSASAQDASINISGSAEAASMITNGDISVMGGRLRVMSCPETMTKVTDNLCIDNELRDAHVFWQDAMNLCRKKGYHVCTYSELDVAICKLNDDGIVYNANGLWMGNYIGNRQVLCGNTEITTSGCKNNFEGDCAKNYSEGRQYYCCHSLGSGQ